MGRSVALLASTALAILLLGGVAWAATVQCPEPEFSKCVGTGGPDTIYGTDENPGGFGDWIKGREGDDKIYGRGGDDRSREFGGGLHGGKGDDLLRGGTGLDHIYGGSGADRIYGGSGPDLLEGDVNLDRGFILARNRAGDLFVGGPGDDSVDAQDGTQERVYCGDGYDDVYADNGGGDNPYDRPDFVDDSCEDVTRY